jgi:hypothetical protein
LRTLPNVNDTRLLALNSPDVSVIVKRKTLEVMPVIVALPEAPTEGDTKLSKLSGEQAGAAELAISLV